MRRAALLSLALLAACEPELSPTGRTVRVALGADPTGITGWRHEHRVEVVRALDVLGATGDRWELVTGEADVTVQPFDAGRCTHAGEYAPGSRVVRLDYACAPGSLLAVAVAHELLHWLTWERARWVGHLCAYDGEAPDCHPSVRGVGVQSPYLPAQLGPDGEPLGPVSPDLTTADRALLRALEAP